MTNKVFVREIGDEFEIRIPYEGTEPLSYRIVGEDGVLVAGIAEVEDSTLVITNTLSDVDEFQEYILIITGGGFTSPFPVYFIPYVGEGFNILKIANRIRHEVLDTQFSIISIELDNILAYTIKSYVKYEMSTIKNTQVQQIIYLNTIKTILNAVLTNVLTREVVEASELKVDDSRLVKRILEYLEKLEDELQSLEIALGYASEEDIFGESLPPILSQETYLIKNRYIRPRRMSQEPEPFQLSHSFSGKYCVLTWDVYRNADFNKYVIKLFKGDKQHREYNVRDSLTNSFSFIYEDAITAAEVIIVNTDDLERASRIQLDG